jgi:hypothetical protein
MERKNYFGDCAVLAAAAKNWPMIAMNDVDSNNCI